MKKILLLSVTLVTVVFATLAITSCKKDKNTSSIASLEGTFWTSSEDGFKETFQFFADGDFQQVDVFGEGNELKTPGTYEYDGKGKGIIKFSDSNTLNFTISGNTLTDELGNKYTKE